MGPNASHIEARIGDSMIVFELSDPPHEGATIASVYVYVPDVDAACARAIAYGAGVVAAPEDKPYQECGAGVKEPMGNVWWISTFLQQ